MHNYLKEFRELHEITEEELAIKANIPLETYMKYERNEIQPDGDIIKKLCICLWRYCDCKYEIFPTPEYKKMSSKGEVNNVKNIEKLKIGLRKN